MKKIFFFLFATLFITTTSVSAQTYFQPVCPPAPQQGRMAVQVPFQGVVLPLDQNGNIRPGTYQASVYVFRTPTYGKVISVVFFMAGNNTPFEINGRFTRPPSDWNGFFLESEQMNLRNPIYESGSSYRNANGSRVIMGGDYIVPKRIPALLHFDQTGSWAELLLN